MDSAERPHRSTGSGSSSNSTSELFICFTSRLSSSSMKISSKSILSPGRAREPSQISLSSSLSRRLRSSGSMKGGQASPMFPTNGKKRGCAFENPEPSSPKVTCIGQVRVKTKKQGKKIRARSKRRDVSFRKMEHSNSAAATTTASINSLDSSDYQDYNMGHFLHSSSHHHQQQQQQECKKWVHLPMTICEALRAFGAEFNCFLPCRSSCAAGQREKEEKAVAGSGGNGNVNGNGSSCGAVFARWLVAVQEGEGKEREIELMVGKEEIRESTEIRSSQRRHVFEDIEINDCKDENAGEQEGRVSICIPPKNALLLMRCRSDPVKMAALANRFLESPSAKDELNEEDDEDENEEEEEKVEAVEAARNAKAEQDEQGEEEDDDEEDDEDEEEEEESEEEGQAGIELEIEQEACEVAEELGISEVEGHADAACVPNEEAQEQQIHQERSPLLNSLQEERNTGYPDRDIEPGGQQESAEESSPDNLADPEKLECEENAPKSAQENEHNHEPREEHVSEETISSELEYQEDEEEQQEAESRALEQAGEEETEIRERPEPGCPRYQESDQVIGSKEEKESQQKLLPDCLLLMMCEPKLSMEVSKETWVCGTDFIRWLPEGRPPVVNKKKGGDEPKRRISIDSKPAPQLLQPPRSSCSFPVAPPMAKAAAGGASMATMIEQKLVGGKGYEPFVLTRCKSEPMRSAAKLAPDACFWKNRKLEPATLGVGAAGVGF